MAFVQPLFNLTGLKAGADLSSKQFYFVKLSAEGTVVVCSGATDIPIGVLQNKPESGQDAQVMCIGVSKVSADAALSVGNLVGTSADGQADAKTVGTDTTEYVCGRVLTATTGASGQIATVALNCLAPHRAA